VLRPCRWGRSMPSCSASSAVVPKVTFWFLMGDTMATQCNKVSQRVAQADYMCRRR